MNISARITFLLALGSFMGNALAVDKAPEKNLPQHDFNLFADSIRKELSGHLAGGYAYVVMYNGKVVAYDAQGWARAPWEKTDPSVRWTIDKPMPLASVSKTITAVAMLKLWDESEHRFSLDDAFWPHIRRLVPRVHDDVKKITIRQLLMHRSGLAKPNGDALTVQQLQKLLMEPLAHAPGEEFAYDNNNFYIAGKVIEEIGRVRYTKFVNDHVFRPLGIADMETHWEHEQPTCGYGALGDKAPGYPYEWEQADKAGAAGWYGSAESLCKFLHALREHKILSAEAEKAFFSDNLGWDINQPCYAKGGDFGYDDGKSHGETHSSICYFPDYVEAVLLINCKHSKGPGEVLINAWKASREKHSK